MEDSDYLKKQIDQVTKALGKMLPALLGLKDQGKINEGIEITDQSLKQMLGFDLEGLAAIPTDAFIRTLQEKKKFSNADFDRLAEIFLLIADELDNEDPYNKKSTDLYNKCLTMYEYLNTTGSTYSLDRHMKADRIKKYLA